jgi:hypothetical protein
MNEDQAPRQNAEGHSCPPWCDIDHALYEACVGSGGRMGDIWTRAIRTGDDFYVSIQGALPDPAADWPRVALGPREAESMAVIVGLLADATPDQHRELADAIRQAAADITDETGEKP